MKQSYHGELNELVTRFWNGETSLREEDRLRHLLSADDVPAEYEGLAQYFNETVNDDSLTDESIPNSTTSRSIPLKERILIALVVAFLLALAVWYVYATRKLNGETGTLPIDTSSVLSSAWDETFVLFRDLILSK
ncbi:MAG: hypothetical protein GC193_00155 [Cryomorphaceae bacterium]|nr:hypothetical protein [Cryomorphaceae bacterium]